LRKKEFSKETIQAVTDRLCRAGLLDDEAFARYWIENREQFKPRGQYALRHELRQKGIDSSIIDALLEDLDETESAYRVATKQLARWKRLDPSVRRKKMIDHMRRRGFSYETAQHVWERMVTEHGIDQDDIENGEDATIWNGET
jgi:regulatory protein